MTSSPNPESLGPRAFRVRRWRTILAGCVLASVGFVAAQAGSFGFLEVEFAKIAKAVDDMPIAVRTANHGQPRSYSESSGDQRGAASFGAARRAGLTSTMPDQPLKFEASDIDDTGDAMTDAGLFELSSAAMPTRPAASQQAPQFGGRFHGLIDGRASAPGRPAYGNPGRGASRTGLADCCLDPATQQGNPLLTAPVLDDAISGPVPEPVTWAMMILGFGLSGVVLRGQRRRWA
jgi:hypothetical protein